MGTLPDTPTPGRKRVAPGEVVERTVERRQKRMIKNRESAARSRARKQMQCVDERAYTHELENKVSRVEEENERLKWQKIRAEFNKKFQQLMCGNNIKVVLPHVEFQISLVVMHLKIRLTNLGLIPLSVTPLDFVPLVLLINVFRLTGDVGKWGLSKRSGSSKVAPEHSQPQMPK